MNVKIVKVMARFGTPSSVVGAFMIAASILLANNWSFSGNVLGDLGVMGSGSMIIYNSGLLMAGSLAMLLAAGLFEFTTDDIVGQIGSAVFLAYSLAVVILGISILDLGDWVQYASPAIYIMIPASSVLLSYNFYNRGMRMEAGMGVVAALFGALCWVLGGPVTATNQVIALAPFSVWQIMFGLHMYRLEYNEWD